MAENTIRDILLLQKRELEDRTKELYIDRNGNSNKLQNNLIKVIIGPRRAGKSFFAIHLLKEISNFGYANFDDERLIDITDYDDIINTINTIYNNPKFILFDEIQNLHNWELFVNRLQRQGHNLVITGSNSKLLSKELSTHLTGRHILLSIFPFSFKEFLQTNGAKELTKSEIKEKLSHYLTNGGYPEPIIKKLDTKEYLLTLFNSIIYKDIIKRFKIRSAQAIENLATHLISNTTKEFSYNTLSKITKCKSAHTVEKYINYLEESFIFFTITGFSFKTKKQASTNKKIYCTDNGLIHAKAITFSPDLGKLYENLVAITLKKQEINDKHLYYWKNPQKEEVDFVLQKGTHITELIQVCYNLHDPKTKERETRALLKASKELKCNNLIIITNDYDKEEQTTWFGIKRKIKYTPLWKWLLQKY